MTLINKIEIPDKTWTDLEQNYKFSKFLQEYISLLKSKLQIVEVMGQDHYSYYTCGQTHDPRNPDWEPFRILWQLCKKYDYDFFLVKEIIEEGIGRKLTCECQILNDDKAIRRRKLETVFGVDFEGSGRKDFDLV